jgi:hypothetical protein
MYGSQVWTLSKRDKNNISVCERKALRKIFGSVRENGTRRIRTNCELIGLCREIGIRNYERNITMFRTCGRNVRRKKL